jgi:predicted RNA binding protein YcfA (HicA-like mRNA interferase family)
MSTKLPVVNANKLIKILQEKGFSFSRQSGSHAIYANQNGIKVTVPIHGKKDLGKGLLKQIMNDAGLSKEDFQ